MTEKIYRTIIVLCGMFTLLFVFGIFSSWRDGSLLFFIFKYGAIFLALIAAMLVDYISYNNCKKSRTKIAFKQRRTFFYLAIPVVFYLWIYVSSSGYQDCDQYSNKLNGGMRTFQGKKYNIRLCGVPDTYGADEIRMQVLDQNGDVLAIRHFIIYFNDVSEKALHYSSDKIFYNDSSKNESLSTLSMPPTTMDWIKARIPFID